MSKRAKRIAFGLGAALAVVVIAFFAGVPEMLETLFASDSRALRPPPPPAATTPHRKLLLLAIDGMDRALLYEMLRAGRLPELSSLLGGAGFGHAYFEPDMLSTLPSSTIAAWATVLTGETPAAHGVTGNEFFIREDDRFAAPAGVSVPDPDAVLSIYTDGYANDLLEQPTVYERLKQRAPGIVIWSSMLHFFRGADRLLTADRTILVDAFAGLLEEVATPNDESEVYEELDQEAIETLLEELDEHASPDVITLYLCGNDHYAHGASIGPDPARRRYLVEVLEPLFARLRVGLELRGLLADRYVLLTSDHGHTEVRHDDAHALSTEGPNEPPAVLRSAGFRVRPFELEVEPDVVYDAVLAYQGAMAFVYVADRASCDPTCDWRRPPRYEEDVLPVAEAFWLATRDGRGAPGMRGTLDMVLTRRPVPFDRDDVPFEVYVGGAEVVSIEAYLRQLPHETYVAFEERMRELAVGRYGERAGDVLLLANNGNVASPDLRYYFASLYRSWHGSPSRKDSEIPLILAHPDAATAELRDRVREVVGTTPRQHHIAPLIEALVLGD